MIAVFFLYGLAFFTMGVAVVLETRRTSALPFGRQLPWLAAFGIVHGMVEWADMFLLISMPDHVREALYAVRMVLLPISALLLMRFGYGLMQDAGPLPDKVRLLAPLLLVPGAFVAAYAVTVSVGGDAPASQVDVWSRYLIYGPACLLTAFAFFRQWRALAGSSLEAARAPLLVAALAFFLNAIVAGLIVPAGEFGLARWINQEGVLAATGVPVQVWRALCAIIVAICVVRTLDVFEAERQRELSRLAAERDHAQNEARRSAEEWTNSLVAISRSIADLADIDAVLQLIVAEGRHLLIADTASLGLLDDTGEQLVLKCYATADGPHVATGVMPVRSPFILETVHRGQPSVFPDDMRSVNGGMTVVEPIWFCPILHCVIRSALIVPLQIEGKILGALWVGRYGEKPFGPHDVFSLERLAHQSVIALEHSLMAARLQSLAVIEERSRLAREMHDGLAQILGYLGVEMQTLEILAKQDQRDELVARLQQARSTIAEAHAELRENILSLRTTLSGEVGLVAALQQYVEEFGVQTGIDVEFSDSLSGPPLISPLAETQLVRIIQEALTNVRRHARARHVHVHIGAEDGCLAVSLRDDGIGFVASDNGHDHLGVRIMHERAGSIGATLAITSHPGNGTIVHVRVPLVPDSGGRKRGD